MENIDRFNTLDSSYYVEQGKRREGMSGSELNRLFQKNYYEVAASYNTATRIGLQNMSEDQLWRLLSDINDTIDTLKQVPGKNLGFGEIKYDVIGGFQTLDGMKSVVFSEIRHRNRSFSSSAKNIIDIS